MKNAKRLTKQFLSLALSAAMCLESLPVQALEAQGTAENYLPQVEIGEDILQNDVFYLGTTQAVIPENGHAKYLMKIGRGGEAASESTALLKIADLTASYGQDYEVTVRGSKEKVDNPKDNASLMEMIEGSPYEQMELADEEDALKTLSEDEEGKKALGEGLQEAYELLAEAGEGGASGKSDPEEETGTAEETDTADGSSASKEGSDVIRKGDGSETLQIGKEPDGEDAFNKARSMFSGEEGTSQRLTSDQDMAESYQELQRMANVMTDIVVGATLELNFPEGVKEKIIEINPKDNREGDGDKMFYMVLGAPRGSTTNSAASTCAITIKDDEESEPAVVSFSEETYVHEPGSDHVSITVKREGLINKVSSVQVRTSGNGSALAGRDYSEVEKTLFFPFGIPSLDIDIPVRTKYFNGEKDFELELVPEGGCKAGLAKTTVSLTGTFGEEALDAGDEEDTQDTEADGEKLTPEGLTPEITATGATNTQAYTLASLEVLDPIDMSKPDLILTDSLGIATGGKPRSEWQASDKRWRLCWEGGDSYHHYHWNTGVAYKLSEAPDPYWIDGAMVRWGRQGEDAEVSVDITGDKGQIQYCYGAIYGAGSSERHLYHSTNNFKEKPASNDFKRMYPSIKEGDFTSRVAPGYIHFLNHGNCKDCNWLYLYEVKPILRPFLFEYKANDTLKFLDEDGNYVSDGGVAADARIIGSTNNQLVTFVNKGGVTVKQDVKENTLRYVRFTGFKLSADGESWYEVGTRSTNEESATFNFTEENITKLVGKMGEEKFHKSLLVNNFVTEKYTKQCQPMYSRLFVRPEFEKIPVKTTLYNPYDFPVTLEISSFEYYLEPLETREVEDFFLGDKLAVYARLDKAQEKDYKAVGITLRRKTSLAKDWDGTETPDFSNNKPVYISGTESHRINYEEIRLEPRIQENNNAVMIRIKDEDLSYFNRETGILKGQGVKKEEDPGYTWFTYLDSDHTVTDKVYPIPAEPLDENTICRWYDRSVSRYYEGNTLYFTATGSKEKNVLTLEPVRKIYDTKLTGILRYMKYSLLTKKSGLSSAVPASGAMVSAGSGSATADENGRFETAEFPVHGPDREGEQIYVRYMVSVNGKSNVQEALLRKGATELDVSQSFGNGVSPVGSDIFNNYTLEAEYAGEHGYSKEDNVLPIAYSEEVVMKLRIKPAEYLYSDVTPQGDVIEEYKLETPRKAQFLLYDKNGKLKGKYATVEGTKGDDGYVAFTSNICFAVEGGAEPFTAMPDDMVYLRLMTDRMTMKDTDFEDYEYTYSDIYTGYSLAPAATFLAPIPQGITSPVNFKYKKLPFLSDVGTNLALPFAQVGYVRTGNGGWRMYIGVSVSQVVDLIKETHMSKFCDDDGRYWKDLWALGHPFASMWNGLKESYATCFTNRKDFKEKIDEGFVGHPTWKIDIMVGAYFDFEFPEVTMSTGDKLDVPDYVWVGWGGFVSVNLGFKMTWYFVIPVVFIPAYIGIEIEGTVFGFLGGEASKEDTVTYEDTYNYSIDFADHIDHFTGAVNGLTSVQLQCGVGLCGVIGIRCFGRIETIANYTPSKIVRDYGVWCNFKVGFLIDMFLFSKGLDWSVADWKWGSFKDWEKMGDGYEKEVDPVSTNRLNAASDAGEGFRLREGAGTDSVWAGSVIGGDDLDPVKSAFRPDPEKETVLVRNAYERPDSKLITLQNGTVVLAFIDSDNSKGKYQRTTLKLAACVDGKWSEPVPVCKDETADFQPSIAEMKDGRVLVAWTSTGSPDITEKTSLEDYLKSMEIYAAIAKVDPDGKISLSDAEKITNDHNMLNGVEQHYYDCRPTVVCDMESGDAMVYYIKSGRVEGTDMEIANPYTNDSAICYLPYSAKGVEVTTPDGKKTEHWLFDYFYPGELGSKEEEQWMIDNFSGQRFLDSPANDEDEYYAIPDFTAIGYNGLAVYAYSVDPDGNMDTDADRDLFLQVYDFRKHETLHRIRLTEDDTADAMPKLFRSKMASSGEGAVDDATDTKLFWYRGGSEVVYINLSKLIREGINPDGTLVHHKDDGGEGMDNTYADPIHIGMPVSDSHSAKQMADFVVTEDDNGSIYMVWTEPEGEGQEIFASSLLYPDPSDENAGLHCGWSKKYRLTNTGLFNDELAVTLSGEDLMVVHNQFRQELNEDEEGNVIPDNPLKITDVKLVANVLEPCGAVEAQNVSLIEVGEDGDERIIEYPRNGQTVDIDVELLNGGLTQANGYKAALYAVEKDGKETLFGEQTVDERLMPSEIRTLRFENCTLPQDVDGLCFRVVVRELKEGSIYYENNNKPDYVSDPLQVKGNYSFDNLNAYQLSDGFHINGTITNNGNKTAAEGEEVTIKLSGPFDMDLEFDEKERILGTVPIEGLAPGETKSFEDLGFTDTLKVTPEMLKEFGYIEVMVAVLETRIVRPDNGDDYQTVDRVVVGNSETVWLKGQFPVGLAVSPISIEIGDSKAPQVLDSYGKAYDDTEMQYSLSDQDVAVMEDGKVLGLKKGKTTLIATHAVSGIVTQTPVVVGGSIAEGDIQGGEEIPDQLWYVAIDGNSFPYTGKKIKPAVRIYDGTEMLAKGKDYTVTYANNLNAYTLKPGDPGFDQAKAPKVIVKGKGNYSGQETVFFTITPVNLFTDPAVWADDPALKYTGKELKVKPVVKWGKKKLKQNRDYTLSITKKDTGEAVNAVKDQGVYELSAKGKGNFDGVRIFTLTVYDANKVKPVSALSIDKVSPQKYTGGAVEPKLVVKDGEKELKPEDTSIDDYEEALDSDYFVRYYNNVDAGTAYAVITGKPERGYAGSKKVSFTIQGTTLKGAKLTGLPKEGLPYTGSAVTLDELFKNGTVKVTAKDGTPLYLDGTGTESCNILTTSYQNNIKAGKAKVLLTGTKGCTGSLKVGFTISKAELSSANITAKLSESEVPYVKSGAKPGVIVKDKGRTLREGVDYKLAYQNNKDLGDASVTVTGKGNYRGTYPGALNFKIIPSDLGDLTLTAEDMIYADRADNFKTRVSVTDEAGKKLSAGKDYEKDVSFSFAGDGEGHLAGDPVPNGAILPAGSLLKATVKAMGRYYKGTASGTFRIAEKSLSKVALSGSIPDQIYTGEEITLEPKDIPMAVKASETDGEGKTVYHWEIVEGSYRNNVRKGTASVTLRGCGDYGGTKTVKFKIVTKDLKWEKPELERR